MYINIATPSQEDRKINTCVYMLGENGDLHKGGQFISNSNPKYSFVSNKSAIPFSFVRNEYHAPHSLNPSNDTFLCGEAKLLIVQKAATNRES
jgi:hypothetical protein